MIITFRCGIYPGHILYSTLYDAAGYIEFFSAYYIFNGLLVTLQVLHCVWTYFLIKVKSVSHDQFGTKSIYIYSRLFTKLLSLEALMTREVKAKTTNQRMKTTTKKSRKILK